MAQYEADKLARLLQFCCWKARCGMDPKGFKVIAQKISDFAEPEESTPNERYFMDLLSELNSAMKRENQIGKREDFIKMILRFSGFDHWVDWETKLYNAGQYVQADKLDLAPFSEIKIAFCLPEELEKQVYPDLTYARRNAAYPVELLSCKEKEISDQLKFVLARLDEFPVVIWAIPTAWKEQLPALKDPSWDDLILTGRVVPVWIDKAKIWDTQAQFIPWLKHHQTIGGMSGLLTSLLFTQEVIKKYHSPLPNSKSAGIPASIQHFHNHSSGFINQGNINGQHNTQQNITNNYHKLNDES